MTGNNNIHVRGASAPLFSWKPDTRVDTRLTVSKGLKHRQTQDDMEKENPRKRLICKGFCNEPGGIRTHDLLIRREHGVPVGTVVSGRSRSGGSLIDTRFDTRFG